MRKKLKIAFICNVFPNISETFIRNQIDYFVKKNHDVDIITTGHIKDNKILKKYKNVYGMKSNLQKLLFFPFFFIVNLFKNPFLILKSVNFFKYGKEAIYLKIFYSYLIIKNKNYDILMCHFGDSGIVGSFIKKELMKNSKLICMFHGADIRRGIKKKGGVYNQLFSFADSILSISKYNSKYLEKWGSKKLINHPVGVNLDKYRKNNGRVKNKKIKILTVGRLVKEKGYIYSLKAIKKLIRSNPKKNIEYHIIGEGNLRNSIEQYISKNNLKNNIFLHGEKEGKEVIAHYQNADLFLLTSINEALPVVIMEAQSFEIPVIATNVGSIKEEIIEGKSGFVVKSRNSEEIFKKLQWLISHQNIWKKFGKEGRKHIKEKYDIIKLNKKLEKLFYKFVKEKNANV